MSPSPPHAHRAPSDRSSGWRGGSGLGRSPPVQGAVVRLSPTAILHVLDSSPRLRAAALHMDAGHWSESAFLQVGPTEPKAVGTLGTEDDLMTI